jgi:ribosomal protein S18 acetylase RimI-like enzyme
MENTEPARRSTSVLVRDFRKSDLKDTLNLFPLCFAEEFEISGFDPDHMTEMVNRAFGRTGRFILALLRFSGREPLKVLVAETDGRVVGTTIVNVRGRFGYISSVMVHPDNRRKGIATTLIVNALSYLRRRKLNRAVLHVMSSNAPAIGAYVKLGFKKFDQSVYLVRETESVQELKPNSFTIREFQNGDTDQIYDMILASEDPNYLRIFDFSKNNLKTPLLQHVFRFSTQRKLVALLGDRVVGYVEATHTTPKEIGRINSVYVNEEGESLGLEKVLIEEANNQIVKSGVRRVRIAVPVLKQELLDTVKSLGFKEVLKMDAMIKEFDSTV